MERLTIDEVIEHCNKTCDMTEKIAKARGHELESIESNQFWEHYQVRAWLKELKQYKNLEEQGLLLRLPCKVGTSVYMVAQDCGGDTLDCMRGDCEGCPYLYSFVEENKFEAYMCDDISKTVFLTKAEAEQKLKEMESD